MSNYVEWSFDRPPEKVKPILDNPRLLWLFRNWDKKPRFIVTKDVDDANGCFISAIVGEDYDSYNEENQEFADRASDLAFGFLYGYFCERENNDGQ